MALSLTELDQINALVTEGKRLEALAANAESVSLLNLRLGGNLIEFTQGSEVHNAIRNLLKSRVEANKQQLKNMGIDA